jgi:serine/threonine protein kinase
MTGDGSTNAAGQWDMPTAESPRGDAIEASESMLSEVGSYTILGVIGTGGMGIVYRAEQRNPKRTVALKVVRSDLTTAGHVRRFELESRVLGRLAHPGIAQVYEAGTAETPNGRQPFFAMELVEGEPLDRYAATHDLSVRDRLELVARVCDAVEHAHEKGVVHRDLKPGNIVVRADGQPKVLDFGVARLTDSDVRATTIQTDVGQLVGTVPYMSPEQCAADPAELDARSDVYALGVILYELLAGRLPYEFGQAPVIEMVRVIRESDHARLSAVDRSFRGDVETIIGKALEKEKQRRYQSAAALATDIRRYLDHQPIAARPPSTMYQLGKFARRNRQLVGGIIAVFIALVVGIIATTAYALHADTQRRLAEQRFDDLRALARVVVFDMDPMLRTLPGATPLRELMVDTSLEYLDRLVAEKPDDLDLQQDVAEAYLQIAYVLGSPTESSLGRWDEALMNFRRAEVMLADLIEAGRDSYEVRSGWISALESEADITALSDPDAALKMYDRVVQLWAELYEDHPRPRLGTILANAHGRIADVHWKAGRHDEALMSNRRQCEITKKVLEEDPDDPLLINRYASAVNFQGSIYLQRAQSTEDGAVIASDLEKAEVCLVDSTALMRTALEQDPNNWVYMRTMALMLGDVSELLGLQGRAEKSLEVGQQSLEQFERLVELDPRNHQGQRDVAVSCYRLGMVHEGLATDEQRGLQERIEHLDKSLAWYIRSRATFERMREMDILRESDAANLPGLDEMIAEMESELASMRQTADASEGA